MKNIIKIMATVALTIVIGSCDKNLDLAPRDQLSPETFWKNGDDWRSWVNTSYNSLGNHANGTLDQNSDLTIGSGSNEVSAGTYLAPQTSNFYNDSYGAIRNLNIGIDKYENAESEIQAVAERYTAEMRFFRARTYFALLKAYGGVILVDQVLDLDSEELFVPRSSRTVIADFILADLDWAETRLPGKNQLADSEVGRITSEAVQAFGARVALFEGTWQKYHGGGDSARFLDRAINSANAVINGNAYTLYNGMGDESYYFLFLDEGEGNDEAILSRRYDQAVGTTHNTSRWVDTQVAVPTKNLADLYVCKDGLPISSSPLFQGRSTLTSEFEDRDLRMLSTIMKPGTIRNVDGSDVVQKPNIGAASNGVTATGYQPRKFLANGINATSGAQTYDFYTIRYAEVLLTLAEALYEKNGSISDEELNKTINLLRARAGVANLTNVLVSGNSLDMLTEIRRERTIELAYEGFRYDDLRRWKTAETLLPLSLRGVQFVGTEFETEYPAIVAGDQIAVDGDGFIVADPSNVRQFDLSKHYLQPLPTEEIQLNSNIEQNPNW